MKEEEKTLVQTFRNAAANVSAIVSEVKTMEAALAYTVALSREKKACNKCITGYKQSQSTSAENLCGSKQQKLVAGPGLPAELAASLERMCETNAIGLIREGLRDHLAGIDIGLTIADFGIAETGTLVIDSSSEEVRLATMISEVHVAVLPVHRIRPTAFDIETELSDRFRLSPNYYAFITGASRTADIERILALGVHGPLELHILLLSN